MPLARFFAPRAAAAGFAALVSLLALPALAAPFCGASARLERLEALRRDPHGPVMIAAHRAGHLQAPENSLAAVDEGVAAGTDFIEIDVRVTSDGVPYVMHDHTLDRTTTGTGPNAQLTYRQLRALRLKGDGSAVPTLQDVLMRSCGKVLVDLDMKTDKVAPVIAVVESLGMVDQVVVFDSDSDTLRAARALQPALAVMTRLRAGLALSQINRGLAPITQVHGDPASLTPAAHAAIAAIPARIWANALGDVDAAMARHDASTCVRLGALRAMGVSMIQTDYPALLRATLQTCGLSGALPSSPTPSAG
ncbi:glycerophosphodiester phosphodiesterase family protein [Novosphingobium sp. 1949]|uniref:Glycerophosphodiester phosphodiesterase family protein n=1 Tax=Novosphingobium organovorum TaxID=2930092 RepID=A0ABT0BJB5_9SPHN|nr:glycerophosphodiester phosphodiesterase family protein [Novosphingobium organovorum]MCJ2184814.1 glycerophosphodiester phosphodiesterase family protein [Novosphingobium organovorum]